MTEKERKDLALQWRQFAIIQLKDAQATGDTNTALLMQDRINLIEALFPDLNPPSK